MTKKKLFIIAEAGVNHNGQLDKALKLCDIANECGADAIKFQTWDTDLLIEKGTKMASYQSNNTSIYEDQYDMLKKLELSYQDFEKINNYCKSIGIEFMSTPDEQQSLEFLCKKLECEKIKIGSSDLTNLPLLEKAASYGKYLIVSTGMGNMEDIIDAINAMGCPDKDKLAFLHCTSLYPCPPHAVNLKSIAEMSKQLNYDIGFSDHTIGSVASCGAIALGANIIEKHFTEDKRQQGPDHIASLDPKELNNFINDLRQMEVMLGKSSKEMHELEVEVRQAVTKKIVARIDIKKGKVIEKNDLDLKRVDGQGFEGRDYFNLVGSTSSRDYKAGELIDHDQVIK